MKAIGGEALEGGCLKAGDRFVSDVTFLLCKANKLLPGTEGILQTLR